MLTIEELQAADIQQDVAKEAYAQAEKRLTDLLETKKSFEQRASTLLTSFTSLALAIIAAGGAFYTSQPLVNNASKWLPYAFFAASLPMLVAIWCMIVVLQPALHGALGSPPESWLRRGVIDSEKNAVPEMLAYVTHDMSERIDASEKSNSARARLIVEGSYWALASPVILCLGAALATALRI